MKKRSNPGAGLGLLCLYILALTAWSARPAFAAEVWRYEGYGSVNRSDVLAIKIIGGNGKVYEVQGTHRVEDKEYAIRGSYGTSSKTITARSSSNSRIDGHWDNSLKGFVFRIKGETFVCKGIGTQNAPGMSDRLNGQYRVTQRNGNGKEFYGTLTLKQVDDSRAMGKMMWSNHGSGDAFEGEISGWSLSFSICYPNGLVGTYHVTCSEDGRRLFNGTCTSNRGDSGTWSAERI